MNIELLEKVQQAILDNPSHLSMSIWTCETSACIAGWTLAINEDLHARTFSDKYPRAEEYVKEKVDRNSFVSIEDFCIQILGSSSHRIEDMFFLRSWPKKYSDAYRSALNDETKAFVAAHVISHYAPIAPPSKEYLPDDVTDDALDHISKL